MDLEEQVKQLKLENELLKQCLNNYSDSYNEFNKETINEKKQLNCSSKYIGVCKHKNKWTAEIVVNDEKKYLGTFDREQDAALARDYATRKFFGDFGNLNFPKIPNWDTYFMNLCEIVKTRSPDYCKVGSVLVSMKNKRIISTGYNSIASGLNDDIYAVNNGFL